MLEVVTVEYLRDITIRCGSGKLNWGEGFTDEVVDYKRWITERFYLHSAKFENKSAIEYFTEHAGGVILDSYVSLLAIDDKK